MKNRKFDEKIKAMQTAERIVKNDPAQARKLIMKYVERRDPNKVEMMENIIWTFLKSETACYKRTEKECEEQEEGVFAPYLKQAATIMKRVSEEKEAEIDKYYRRGYTQSKADEFQAQFSGIYIKRALADGSTDDTRVLEIEYVEGKLGKLGCHMFKCYVALKAARLYIEDKFKVITPELKKVITQIKKLESFWEKEVLI